MNKRFLGAIALAVTAALGLAACSGDEAATLDNGDRQDLTVAVFNGWPEGEAASYLWKHILEEQGYNVKFEYADAGPVFKGLADGDYDLAFDGWLPVTHATYWDKYGDDMEDLGVWNDDAKLTIAVNADAPIDSLEELAANADLFGNQIVGIEASAGLTEATEKSVIPEYGLDGMKFTTSSTPAMLAELKAAIQADENVVVTLWRPHWAYDEFPIKDLADPKGALGGAEGIHTFARDGFGADYPTLAGWLKGFTMSSDLLFSLENPMYNTDEDDVDLDAVVADWMKENQDYVDSLTN